MSTGSLNTSSTNYNTFHETRHYCINELAVMDVTGDEALSFLNRQLTNDLNKLSISDETSVCLDWHWSSVCNVQGRVIATFIAARMHQGIKLICHGSLAETLLALLTKLKFRAKVSIALSDQKVWMYSNSNLIDSINDNNQVGLDNVNIINLNDSDGQFSLLLATECDGKEIVKPATSEALKTHVLFNKYLFDRNIALITAETSELFVAQHLGLDEIDALSFNKGCFPGQEVIARLHYKGKSKKSLHLFSFDISDEAMKVIWATEIAHAFSLNDKRYVLLDKIEINGTHYCQAVG